MTTLLHISDLHFGLAHDPRAADGILRLVRELAPTAVICTGDVVEHAEWRPSWRAARDFFAAIDAPCLIVPGNHDIARFNLVARLFAPRRGFREHLRASDTPVLHLDGVVIAGIDTPRRWTFDLGYVGAVCLARVERAFAAAPATALRIAALHHPLRPLGRLPLPRSHVRGSRRAQAALGGLGADVVLSGHSHFPHLEIIEAGGGRFVWAQAGTGASRRFRLGRVRTASVSVLRPGAETLSIEWWYFLRERRRFERGETHVVPRRVR